MNPGKAAANIRHPIGEWVHTSHAQKPLEDDQVHVVEHKLGSKLVTVDVVKRDQFPKRLFPRVKQLFRADFYYGHCQYFPKPFKLVNRTYINGTVFDYQEHLKKFKK